MSARPSPNTERVSRTATKPARRNSNVGARTSPTQKPRQRNVATAGRPSADKSASEGRREIGALVLFGIAVFLIFVLVAGDTGGVVGQGARSGLVFALGRLAFLLPAALLVAAVALILEKSIWRSSWFAGALVFLFGLFVLFAAGFVPFGSHSKELFVRAEFEGRAGGLGEALYAGLHALVGTVGVAIIGWIALLVGLGLATGLTVRQLGRDLEKKTRKISQTARRSAEESTVVHDKWRGRAETTSSPGPILSQAGFAGLSTPTTRRTPRGNPASPLQLGPRDLVGDATPAPDDPTTPPGFTPFAGEFEEWADGRPPLLSPLAPLGGAPFSAGSSSGTGVVDGEQLFADLYASTEPGDLHPESAATETTDQETDVSVSGAGSASPLSSVSEALPAPSRSAKDTPREGGTQAGHVGTSSPQGPTVSSATLADQASAGTASLDPADLEPTYLLPQAEILRKSAPSAAASRSAERDTAGVLLHALAQFGVEARIIGMVVGPRVTRYELQLAPGTKVSKVTNLKDDLAYALASTEIRILAPIPGKSAVGVEVPNQRPDFVTLGDIYREFPKSAGPLMVWLGKDISGKAVYTDLTRLPHLLIAGTTGSGKSGCINCIVSSVLLRSTPDQVRMIMIDPKKVELSHYDRIPHLLVPVVTNMKDAAGVLYNVAKEMEDRYELMELERARNLPEMNKTRARRGEQPLPYILVVIDELADLMMVSPQEVEEYVIRLAQKSRAVGIHLVVATQRPSADVITGMIKANIPSRIAFAVSSQTDSRVILDVNGAETLLGMGDMLFKPLGSSQLQRIQGAYITEEEIALLVNHWRRQAEPEFREELLRQPPDAKKGTSGAGDDMFDPDSDDLLADAARLVIETGSASVSMLQRRLRVGYTRAGRLIDMLERRGIVGPWEGSKPRQILVQAGEFERVIAALQAEDSLGDGSLSD